MKRSPFNRKPGGKKTAESKTAGKTSGGTALRAAKVPDYKAQAQRAVIRALAKAKRLADRAGVKLSDWEDEFIGSVTERIKTYGRAFADPEKGDPRAPISMLQAVKLKEIAAKAKGEKKAWPKPRKRKAK